MHKLIGTTLLAPGCAGQSAASQIRSGIPEQRWY
jgi:hypothetical protein